MARVAKVANIKLRLKGATGFHFAELEKEIEEALDEARTPGSVAHSDATAKEIDIAALPAEIGDFIQARPSAAGIGAIETAIIAFASLAAKEFFTGVVMPKIKRVFGEDAAVEQKVSAPKKPTPAAKKPPKPKDKAKGKAKKKDRKRR
jgi:hypothetical protein